MTVLDAELAAYRTMADELEQHSKGKWALVKDSQLVSILDSFEQAAALAMRKFGRGPYLIRQIGAPPLVLHASLTRAMPRAG